MKLEVVVIPVSDVDRAKSFYGGLGWRLDEPVSAVEVQAARDARLSIPPPGIRTESLPTLVSAVGKRDFAGQRQRPRTGP